MKLKFSHLVGTAAALLALAAGSAQARDVHWNVGIHAAPGVTIGVGNGYPVYAAPPVYHAPPPPVYYAPAAVYYGPRYYAAPAPVYYGPPRHRHGHRHHHHRRHHHGR